jgi:hypothetical protein
MVTRPLPRTSDAAGFTAFPAKAGEDKAMVEEAIIIFVFVFSFFWLFFLPESVTFISRFIFCGFPDQTRSYQGTMHSTKKGAAEYTSSSKYIFSLFHNRIHLPQQSNDNESTKIT